MARLIARFDLTRFFWISSEEFFLCNLNEISVKILDFGFILMIFLKTFLIFLLNDGIFASAVVDTDGTAMSANTDDGTSAIAALADDGSVRSTPNEKAGGAGAGDSNKFHGERHILEIEYFLLQKKLKKLQKSMKELCAKNDDL